MRSTAGTTAMTKARTAAGTALVRAGEQLTMGAAAREDATFERFVSLLNCYDRKTKPVRPFWAFISSVFHVLPGCLLTNASNPLEAGVIIVSTAV